MIVQRKDKIRFKYVGGLIRGYRDDKDKPAVSESQYQSINAIAQTITIGNIPKVYEAK